MGTANGSARLSEKPLSPEVHQHAIVEAVREPSGVDGQQERKQPPEREQEPRRQRPGAELDREERCGDPVTFGADERDGGEDEDQDERRHD